MIPRAHITANISTALERSRAVTLKRTCKRYIHQRGFTMIEMVVVLIVMAIMSTFIWARATPDSNDLIAQADILKSHLRYAQIRAMNDTLQPNNHPRWEMNFPNDTSYALYRYRDDGSGIKDPFNLPGENSNSHTLTTGISMATDFGSNINFNDWGIPVTSVGSTVGAPQTITLSQGTTTSNVTITKNTGYIP
jgi:prepilin-type N-terminal cleavage/methylation domain-containing protein